MNKTMITLILLMLGTAHQALAYQVTEVMYDPLGADSDREWVEFIGNALPSSSYFVEGGSRHQVTLLQGSCVENCVIIIADNALQLLSEYSLNSQVLLYDSSWSSLSNSGEQIGLEINGETVLNLTYPASAQSGESIHFDGVTWYSAPSTPGLVDMSSEVPEFSTFMALVVLLCVLFIVRKK